MVPLHLSPLVVFRLTKTCRCGKAVRADEPQLSRSASNSTSERIGRFNDVSILWTNHLDSGGGQID